MSPPPVGAAPKSRKGNPSRPMTHLAARSVVLVTYPAQRRILTVIAVGDNGDVCSSRCRPFSSMFCRAEQPVYAAVSPRLRTAASVGGFSDAGFFSSSSTSVESAYLIDGSNTAGQAWLAGGRRSFLG